MPRLIWRRAWKLAQNQDNIFLIKSLLDNNKKKTYLPASNENFVGSLPYRLSAVNGQATSLVLELWTSHKYMFSWVTCNKNSPYKSNLGVGIRYTWNCSCNSFCNPGLNTSGSPVARPDCGTKHSSINNLTQESASRSVGEKLSK